MKYTILINQQVLSKTDLDVIDGAILDYIYFYCNSQNEKVKKQRITDKDGEIWTWVNYSALLKDMPMLKIKSVGAITPRVDKIENSGYIRTKRFQHMKKYFQMTAKSDGLFIQMNRAIHIDEQGYSSKRIGAIHIDEPIKNKYNKEKKIILSATADQIYNSMNSSSGQKDRSADIFSSKGIIEKMINDQQKHIQVVGIYWKWLGWSFENKVQYQSALKRDLRAASALKGYSLARIKRTFKKLDGDSANGEKFAWNLNTVHKTIDNVK